MNASKPPAETPTPAISMGDPLAAPSPRLPGCAVSFPVGEIRLVMRLVGFLMHHIGHFMKGRSSPGALGDLPFQRVQLLRDLPNLLVGKVLVALDFFSSEIA